LPPSLAVGPGDRIKGGVALRSTETDVFIHPYTFRQVCTNGAIMARSTQSRHITHDTWFLSPDADGDLEQTIRSAIRLCCAREAFVESANQMRSAKDQAADMALTFTAFMSSHPGASMATPLAEILRRYDQAHDASAFGLMNAITSVARDTRDPEMKWRLEELGGGVPAIRRSHAPTPRHSAARSREIVEVG
jgi:hypothetical protein